MRRVRPFRLSPATRLVLALGLTTCLLTFLAPRALAGPPKANITISRITTWVTGPVNEDGTINYVAALNAMYGKGVTAENNAAIPLLRAFGPDALGRRIRAPVLEALKMGDLPEKGIYLVSWEEYARRKRPEASTQVPATPTGADDWPPATQEAAPRVWAGEDPSIKAMQGPWSGKDHPLLAEWLRANAGPLALVEEAAKRQRYFVPLVSEHDPAAMFDALLPSYALYRGAGKALVTRAMMRLGDGDFAGARRDLMTAHRLARLISQGPTLVERLVGIAIESLACTADRALARSGRLTPQACLEHLQDLRGLPPFPPIADSIDKCERLCGLDCVMLIARGRGGDLSIIQGAPPEDFWRSLRGALARHALDNDTMLIAFNSWYTRMVAASRRPTHAQRRAAWGSILQDLRELKARSPDTRGIPSAIVMGVLGGADGRSMLSMQIADILAPLLIPTLGRAGEIADRCAVQMDLTELALALAAYRGEQGKYPENLSALKRRYLRGIPDDRFTDKPLQYRIVGKGYLLYSVGEDMRDDGGKEGVGEGTDIVVRVE